MSELGSPSYEHPNHNLEDFLCDAGEIIRITLILFLAIIFLPIWLPLVLLFHILRGVLGTKDWSRANSSMG